MNMTPHDASAAHAGIPGAVPMADPGAREDHPLLAIRRVGRTFTTTANEAVVALEGVDLDVKTGEFVSIVGRSGCGKSTLLRLIAGLDRCDAGTILLRDKKIVAPVPEASVVFQKAALLPWMTVWDNIRLPLRVGGYKDTNTERLRLLLKLAALQDFERKYPYELSGGMQQRVSIVRALARDPELLLLDEPFGALDALTRERLNTELQRIWLESRKTVILITHSISEAVFLSDRVIVMTPRPGRILRELAVRLPRPRTHAQTPSEPEYQRLTREIRSLLYDGSE
jgi:NitT/TauT family transport system ATP-binding protein